MAKYGSFKYGPNQKYGPNTIGPSDATIISIEVAPGDRITTGGIPGVFNIGPEFNYVDVVQSLSSTYSSDNIQTSNPELPESRTSFNYDEIRTSGISSTITLVQTIGNPIVINNAGSRFSR